jgi:hypothetical protein
MDIPDEALVGLALVGGYTLKNIYDRVLGARFKDRDHEKISLQMEGIARDLVHVRNDVNDLHQWHDKEDTYGRKLWYRDIELETAMKEMIEALREITREMKEATIETRKSNHNVRALRNVVAEKVGAKNCADDAET